MVPVKVVNVSISNVGFMVLLKSGEDDRSLPIFIGVSEAQAIAMQLNNTAPPRPMTHDLLKNVLKALNAQLEQVVVNGLKDGTFYATLMLVTDSDTIEVDARPSDAIALALRFRTPIYVYEAVMDEAAVVVEEKEREQETEEHTRSHGGTEQIQDPIEHLKDQLAKAVKEERYEDAAQLRDQIKQQLSDN